MCHAWERRKTVQDFGGKSRIQETETYGIMGSELIFGKLSEGVWIGCSWLRIMTGGRFF
jgi:hypothetical protein